MAYSVSPRCTVCRPLADGAICGVTGRGASGLTAVRPGDRSLTGAGPGAVQAVSTHAASTTPATLTPPPAAGGRTSPLPADARYTHRPGVPSRTASAWHGRAASPGARHRPAAPAVPAAPRQTP